MIYMESSSVTTLYYKLLSLALENDKSSQNSRDGEVTDLGRAAFRLYDDNFRIPLLFSRGFNPFLALAEYAWIITGNNKVSCLRQYANAYNRFSDDGETLNGAYGYRLRKYFKKEGRSIDQIEGAISILRHEHTSRRIVLQMWSVEDLGSTSKDLPCNTEIFFKVRHGKLDMTVVNRSNDVFTGVPYNIFVFYILQKFVAAKCSLEIGDQLHFTDSLHLYKRDVEKAKMTIKDNRTLNFNLIDHLARSFSWNGFEHNNTDWSLLLAGDILHLKNSVFSVSKHFFSTIKAKKELKEQEVNINDLLSLSCILWGEAHRPHLVKDLIRQTKGSLMQKFDRNFFEHAKYMESTELQAAATRYAFSSCLNLSSFRKQLDDEFIKADISDEELLKTAFYSAILSGIDTELYSGSEVDRFKESLRRACKETGVDFKFALKLLPYIEMIYC